MLTYFLCGGNGEIPPHKKSHLLTKNHTSVTAVTVLHPALGYKGHNGAGNPDVKAGVGTMSRRILRAYAIDCLFMAAGIAVGAPAILVMSTLMTGGI
jgi:hypothetical protein